MEGKDSGIGGIGWKGKGRDRMEDWIGLRYPYKPMIISIHKTALILFSLRRRR